MRLGSAAIGEDQPVAVCGRVVEPLQRPVRPHLTVQDKLLEVASESTVRSSIATPPPR